MRADEKESGLISILGKLRLGWVAGELVSIKLPARPPVSLLERHDLQGEDWAEILGLKGVELARGNWSPFVIRVWEQTARIPFGQVRSYGWIARKIGKSRAVRAVGGALHANPRPLLTPCHRVIRSNGKIGGFASGSHWKKFLIEVEKKIVSNTT